MDRFKHWTCKKYKNGKTAVVPKAEDSDVTAKSVIKFT